MGGEGGRDRDRRGEWWAEEEARVGREVSNVRRWALALVQK